MLRRVTRVFVRYAERYIPDPYLYAVLLTFITVAAALIFTPVGPVKVIASWYKGLWAILAFALQMALVLTTGEALAKAPPIKRLLEKLASLPIQQPARQFTVFLTTP